MSDFPVEFIGPFQHHEVVVEGWTVPFLQAHLGDEDQVHLTLDRRLGLDLTVAEAERFTPFLADAIAVALGYTAAPRGDQEPVFNPSPRPVRLHGIVAVETDDNTGD